MTYKKLLQALKIGSKYHINQGGTVYKYTGISHKDFETVEFINSVGAVEVFTCRQINKIEETTDPTSGMKFDGVDKLRWDLVPEEFEEVVKVLTLGAKKYADNNWKFVNPGYDRYYAAARRHMEEFRKAVRKGRPRTDKEMGTHVLANAICCLIFLMWMDMNNWENQKTPPTNVPWSSHAES